MTDRTAVLFMAGFLILIGLIGVLVHGSWLYNDWRERRRAKRIMEEK